MFEDEEDLEDVETQAGADARRRRRPSSLPMRTGKAAGHKPYTPQFSPSATVTVRRLAWALQVSMPKAVDRAVNALPSLFPPSLVCPFCKDSTKCELCAFSQPPAAEQAAPAV
ncbi:MAG: SARP family transcriptional regulator [Treponema sp.]|nr:SARP family transcriptional regulator [Treponema sp.]